MKMYIIVQKVKTDVEVAFKVTIRVESRSVKVSSFAIMPGSSCYDEKTTNSAVGIVRLCLMLEGLQNHNECFVHDSGWKYAFFDKEVAALKIKAS
jgi:hypothetical protein